MTPFCHTNGTQVLPEDERPSAAKPQKSSPFGSGVVVWASPTACPHAFTPNAWLFGPRSPGVPRSIILPLYQSTATVTSSYGAIPNGELVTFYDSGTSIGTGNTQGGAANLTTSSLAAGAHTITATYAGDSSYP